MLAPTQKANCPPYLQASPANEYFHPAQVASMPSGYQLSQDIEPLQPLAVTSDIQAPQFQSATPIIAPAPNTQMIPPPRTSIRATKTSTNMGYLAGFLAAQATSPPGFPIHNQSPPIPTRTMPPRAAHSQLLL